jgi:gamma-glutamylcyclotransferase (GGCT)/AIG2-like uncharacterized protein YtfP
MKMVLVFQFGSNMSTQRLNSKDRLCGDARPIGLVCTVGQYSLGFTVWSQSNNCAAGDLVRACGRHVWGVLYEIPDELLARKTAGNRRSLDAIEGSLYKRRKIKIYKPDNPKKVLTVWTYTVINKQQGLLTSRDYVTHILNGLHEHKAPKEYIAHVKSRIYRNNPALKGKI